LINPTLKKTIYLNGLNDKGEAGRTHPENEAQLFTLASTRWFGL
jgi:hypothetical protein